MTTEELKQKHFKAHWNTSEETAEKHRDISIEFAVALLEGHDCGSFQDYSDYTQDWLKSKINELKQNLK